ncbi:lipopolysaccharide biosynthesis protein [Bifidobacterium saeculare]|uniref:lipopolysaccharide biosynthesis protein n=1 Tax=Bifidobacterium pullorum TaxID=78448 RepID=UPI001873E126|nr:lipopolysaccharide biosynthesis protein [Bifidobacterium pullorum]MBE5064729.1 lipopolysaccharide biosynthesis protein [Bifidobacterium pullorum subsp. saeculare]
MRIKKFKYGIRGATILQFVSKYATILVQLVLTAILARLISPDDFGVLSIVTIFTTFFQLFSDMGIGTAIIQYQELTEKDYGRLFVFSIFLAVGLTCLFCIIAFPISIIYNDSRLVLLCIASSPALIFNTINMVPNGLILKEKKFATIACRLIVSTFLSGLVAVFMAIAGAGCYSLVFQSVLSSLIIFCWNFITRPIHCLSIHFVKSLKSIFSYSAYQFGFSFINYFNRNLDNLVIGRILGTENLGYYDKAYKLTTYPMNNISTVIASVIQPYMAESQDNPERIFICWYKITKFLSLVGAYVATFFFVSAPEIIVFFYGPQWVPSIPIFQVLSITIYFQMLGNPSGAFFQSLGRTDLMFRQGILNTSFTIIALVIGSLIGSLSAFSICICVSFCLQIIPIIYYLLIKAMHVSLSVLYNFIPEIMTAFLTVVIIFLFESFSSLPMFLSLICKILISSICFLVSYVITGNLKIIISIIKR